MAFRLDSSIFCVLCSRCSISFSCRRRWLPLLSRSHSALKWSNLTSAREALSCTDNNSWTRHIMVEDYFDKMLRVKLYVLVCNLICTFIYICNHISKPFDSFKNVWEISCFIIMLSLYSGAAKTCFVLIYSINIRYSWLTLLGVLMS